MQTLHRLIQILKMLIINKEPEILINGSYIKFHSTGDLEIRAGRHLILNSECLRLIGCDHSERIIAAYSMGPEYFQRWQEGQVEMSSNLESLEAAKHGRCTESR